MDRVPSSTRLVLAVGGLYVAQSVIGGVTWTGLPAVMRDQGMSLDGVGLLSLIALPWALKFLWSQQVERFRLPAAGGNRSAMIVLVGGLVCIAGMAAIGLLGPDLLSPVILCLTLVAFAAATVDIACDGLRSNTSRPRARPGVTPRRSAVPISGRRSVAGFSWSSSLLPVGASEYGR